MGVTEEGEAGEGLGEGLAAEGLAEGLGALATVVVGKEEGVRRAEGGEGEAEEGAGGAGEESAGLEALAGAEATGWEEAEEGEGRAVGGREGGEGCRPEGQMRSLRIPQTEHQCQLTYPAARKHAC